MTTGGAAFLDSTTISSRILRSSLRLREPTPHERVIFFDLDNTLYSKQTGIAEQMGHRIQQYFERYLHLPTEESVALGQKYYLDYGLAIKGLLRHFQINPIEYDEFVDGGLDLEQVLRPDEGLRRLLEGMQARRWVFTNAGLQHARRVLQLLSIEDLFEGIVYCDYCEPDFPAKPDRVAYERAMLCAGVQKPEWCYFVDDNVSNVRSARELGWIAVHYDEQHEAAPVTSSQHPFIRKLDELVDHFSDLYKS